VQAPAEVHPESHPQHGAAGDRWAWRRKVRADPRRYQLYRVAVGILGGLLILVSGLIGWMPGPGGIALFLLGLAVLASEFHWARRLLDWARRQAHDANGWARRKPLWVRWLGGAATVAGMVGAAWLLLVVVGIPSWVPGQVAAVLSLVPGAD
jgi:uncharacterized protein (TIGR02611 family)